MDEYTNTKSKKKVSPVAFVIAIVLIGIFVLISVFSGSGMFQRENSLSIVNDAGMETVVYYKDCNTIKSYVETLNTIVYNENYVLVTSVNPDSIMYTDEAGCTYVKAVTSIDEYVETMNYLYYNSDKEVCFDFIPHYIMYQKVN